MRTVEPPIKQSPLFLLKQSCEQSKHGNLFLTTQGFIMLKLYPITKTNYFRLSEIVVRAFTVKFSFQQKMKAMEEELEEVEADHQKEVRFDLHQYNVYYRIILQCLLFAKRSEDWSSRINTVRFCK